MTRKPVTIRRDRQEMLDKLLPLLKRDRGASIKEASVVLGTNWRSVYRHIRTLRALGAGIGSFRRADKTIYFKVI